VKRLLLILIPLLLDCSSIVNNPMDIPDKVKVYCQGDLCCYPVDTTAMACTNAFSGQRFMIYIKIY